jgi:hypothetical protein
LVCEKDNTRGPSGTTAKAAVLSLAWVLGRARALGSCVSGCWSPVTEEG